MSNTTVDVSIVDCLQKNLRTIFTMIGQNLFLKQSSIEFDMLPIHICPQCQTIYEYEKTECTQCHQPFQQSNRI